MAAGEEAGRVKEAPPSGQAMARGPPSRGRGERRVYPRQCLLALVVRPVSSPQSLHHRARSAEPAQEWVSTQ